MLTEGTSLFVCVFKDKTFEQVEGNQVLYCYRYNPICPNLSGCKLLCSCIDISSSRIMFWVFKLFSGVLHQLNEVVYNSLICAVVLCVFMDCKYFNCAVLIWSGVFASHSIWQLGKIFSLSTRLLSKSEFETGSLQWRCSSCTEQNVRHSSILKCWTCKFGLEINRNQSRFLWLAISKI